MNIMFIYDMEYLKKINMQVYSDIKSNIIL